MMSFFKVEENLKLIISYIFDPLLHHINIDLWVEKFPELHEDTSKHLQNPYYFKGYVEGKSLV